MQENILTKLIPSTSATKIIFFKTKMGVYMAIFSNFVAIIILLFKGVVNSIIGGGGI